MLHGRRNLPFFGNLADKASCVDDKTVLFRYTFINCFSVICLKSVSQSDTAVSSQKGQYPYWIRTIRTRWHLCCIYPGNEYADILCLTNPPCLKERRDSLCKKYFQKIMEITHRLNYSFLVRGATSMVFEDSISTHYPK